MCGIFGTIAKDKVNWLTFAELCELNKQRGNLGFGLYYGHLNDAQITHYSAPFDPQMLPDTDEQVALGHIRAPTGGQSANIQELHPFTSEDLYFAHNGLLLNHTSFPQWKLNPAISVDSQVILGGIVNHIHSGLPIIDAIQATISQIDGQQACWLWNGATLYLWRVMSPIYITQTAAEFTFSSIKHDPNVQLLDEGIIYQFSAATQQLQAATQFDFYSPYQL